MSMTMDEMRRLRDEADRQQQMTQTLVVELQIPFDLAEWILVTAWSGPSVPVTPEWRETRVSLIRAILVSILANELHDDERGVIKEAVRNAFYGLPFFVPPRLTGPRH